MIKAAEAYRERKAKRLILRSLLKIRKATVDSPHKWFVDEWTKQIEDHFFANPAMFGGLKTHPSTPKEAFTEPRAHVIYDGVETEVDRWRG